MRLRPRIAGLADILFVSAGAAAFAATPYHLTDLGTISGFPDLTPMSVNVVGGNVQIVGIAQTSDYTDADAWYWTASTGMVNLQTQLSSALGSVDSEADCVNRYGQIVGGYNNVYNAETPGTTEGNGFVYTIGGTPTQVVTPGNTNPNGQLPNNFYIVGAYGVNDSGIACGTGGIGIDPTSKGYTYSISTSTLTNIAPVNDSNPTNYAYKINNNGWVAGWGTTTSRIFDMEAYNGSTWSDLGTLAGKTSTARGIDSNGDVIGESPNASNKRQPVYVPYTGGGNWGTMVNLFTAGSNSSGTLTAGSTAGINDMGQIVGYEYVSQVPTNSTAYLYGTAAASGIPLSNLVANLGGWTLQEATAIDNHGDIVGLGTDSTGATKAFLLTALPGDANLDGKVDINDLTIVLAHYNQTGMTWGQGEFTGSGTVDINDLTVVLAHYDQTQSASAGNGLSAVPEPGALALLAAGVLGPLASAWRKRR